MGASRVCLHTSHGHNVPRRNTACPGRLILTLTLASPSVSHVRVEVWSGRSGWGLVAGVCDHHVTPCPKPLVDEGHMLPPREVPQPATTGQGVTLSVLDQRHGTSVLHKVSHSALRHL